jgi:membrane protease YdiL (CAAX protease family)
VDITAPVEEPVVNLLGLRLPWRPALAVVLSTLLLTFDFYYDVLNELAPAGGFGGTLRNLALDRLALFFVLPILVIVFVFREQPVRYGFRLGDWRAGLKWTLGTWIAATPVLFLAARTPGMVAYYSARYATLPSWETASTIALDLFSWEFLFRGFLLFALYRVAGPSAVVLQAVPFAMAHLGKPPLETLSTVLGGTAFGWLAWRARSFVYPYLIHVYIMILVALVASAG